MVNILDIEDMPMSSRISAVSRPMRFAMRCGMMRRPYFPFSNWRSPFHVRFRLFLFQFT
ncbi:hypothetical protein [Massilia haematophila]|uniref:Uncharacterized protein n=1 Tax=Massilia haematophila TaxID=457923 RepID=A0ABV7PR31_9BURK